MAIDCVLGSVEMGEFQNLLYSRNIYAEEGVIVFTRQEQVAINGSKEGVIIRAQFDEVEMLGASRP